MWKWSIDGLPECSQNRVEEPCFSKKNRLNSLLHKSEEGSETRISSNAKSGQIELLGLALAGIAELLGPDHYKVVLFCQRRHQCLYFLIANQHVFFSKAKELSSMSKCISQNTYCEVINC